MSVALPGHVTFACCYLWSGVCMSLLINAQRMHGTCERLQLCCGESVQAMLAHCSKPVIGHVCDYERALHVN